MVTELEVKPVFKVQLTKKSKLQDVDFNNIPFGRVFSDHMLVIDYKDGKWQQPQILPYGPLQLNPATTVLHYGQAIFEGMKAHKDRTNGDILLFRPDENAARLHESAIRMGMPPIPKDLFLQGLKELVNIDRKWVPDIDEASLYIRPLQYGSDDFIGVHSSKNYKFVVFTCPSGPYFSKPVKVWIEQEFVRAAKGGTGAAKTAGNYAATLYPAMLAKQKGYDQILWTDGKAHKYVEEAGTMNVFFIIGDEVCTPKLDGTILPGITRKSVIQLLRDAGQTVNEREVSVAELVEASEKGILHDAFGVGTAATISYIAEMGNDECSIVLPPVENRTISAKLKATLEAIKRGLAEDKYGWLMRL